MFILNNNKRNVNLYLLTKCIIASAPSFLLLIGTLRIKTTFVVITLHKYKD